VRVGYGKVGRSMPLTLDKCGSLGGDVEMVAVVKTLAERHPDDEFWLIGRNTGERPEDVGLPTNVINPWTEWSPKLLQNKRAAGLNKSNFTVNEHMRMRDVFDELTLSTITSMDHIIMWSGQHGTTNLPMPGVRNPDALTKPHDWSAQYCSYLLRGINVWRDVDPWNREEIWLNSDPRNYLKMRDLKWPLCHPVLSQHTYSHNIKHERYGDPSQFEEFSALMDVAALDTTDGRWTASVDVEYARLEVNGLLPDTPFGSLIAYDNTREGRAHFGMFVNETRRYVKESIARVNVVRDWVLPLQPAWLHGKWSQKSLDELGVDIQPAPWELYFPRLHSVLATLTTPASGTGWATAKPWEAFAAGTVCFFHPGYDVQDNVLGDAPDWLRAYLRVSSPNELQARVAELVENAPLWHHVVDTQRAHFDAATREPEFLRRIESRIYGH
jgi:hypothetical protein